MTHLTVKPRIYFTLIVGGFAALHIGLEALNGGVVTHHLLARDDMPGVSNWWGLVLLPTLAWFLYPFMQTASSSAPGLSPTAFYRLGGAIAYGGITAVSFELGAQQITGIMVAALFPIGLMTPLCRAELLLGMIIGMTFTFGAILPTLVASVIGISSFITHSSAQYGLGKIRAWRH